MAEAQVASLQAELEALRSSSTLAQLSSEQALHDLSAKLSEAEAALESDRALASTVLVEQDGLKRRVAELEDELKKEREKSASESARDKANDSKDRERERESRELLDALERSRSEKEDTEAQISSLRALHSSLQTSHSTLEASLLEATTTSRSTLLRLETANSTITSLTSSKEYLTSELSILRSQSSTSRRESLEQLSALQAQLNSAELEARGATGSLNEVRTKYEGLKKRHEEVISELQRVKEDAGVREGQFLGEMGSMRKLVDAMEAREAGRKARLEEVERALDEDRQGREEREQELLENLREERERGDRLELRCEELREAVERGASSFRGSDDDNGSFALSPEATIAVGRQRKGRSYAEIYAEYVRMQEELVKERAEVKRLGECLAQILGDIEDRAPVLKEQREEYDRLSLEATSLATQLAEALSDREASDRRAAAAALDIDRLTSEAAITSSQLSDLGRQVRTLLRELGVPTIGAGSGAPDDFDESEAEILARAEASGDTDSVVSAHLVTFKSINELQVQNQKLLRITREMGAQMERAEDDARARRRGEENAAVEEAHELILRLKEEVESQRVTLDAQSRERDMLRRMLSVRGEGGSNGASNGNGVEGTEHDERDGARALDIQASFEAYRAEMAVDSLRLREDLAAAQRDAGVARTELAKSKAQTEYTFERLRLLNESYELQAGELTQLLKRSQQLQQNNARQDMATHKTSEELTELRSSSDQLRHENTNLRSEREVWKSVETRLIDENAALSKERTHLADLMRNLQTMQNELERAGSEARRRLEDQVGRLESQTADLKEKLAQETDSGRQIAMRKELESKTYQERIDKLTADHQETREALVVARTSKEHLDQRIADLLLQITAKEEKLAIYEGRGTSLGTDNPEKTREEQLEISVADLRTELRAVNSALERANANVQQFQAIAETEGESLRQLTATYDEYKASTDGAVAEKDVEINGLRERLHSLTTDLTAASTQNSDLHRQIETERTAFEKERKTLEDSMVDLRSGDQAAREAQVAAQDDLRRQAQLAREAHEKYDRELVAHAEDVKRLTEIKDELDGVRATVQEHQTAAEVARANLVASEASWSRQKAALEQEIADLRKRTADLNAQNAVLHTHLESIGSQAARLQQQHAESGAAGASVTPGDGDASGTASNVEELREVIRYIRSEREIVDLQLEFSRQEAARVKHQLDVANRSLEETQKALNEERHKAGESTASSAQHAELLERIHTAKLLRESNQTLRDENEANLRKVTQLDTRLRQALAELDPLKERVNTLLAESESKDNIISALERDNERWKARNQTILAKYERIDPEELQVLKDEVASLQARLATAEQEKADAKLATEKSIERFKGLQTMARNERAKLNTSETEKLQLEAQIAAFAEEKKALEARLGESSPLESQLRDELKTLQTRLEEETTLRVQQAAVFEQQTVELTAANAEKAGIQKRAATMFEDNKRIFRENKKHLETIAELKKTFEEANTEAIEKAVEARVAALPPPAPSGDVVVAVPDPAVIEEAVRAGVATAEAAFTASRDSAIAAAVASATTQLQADLAAAQAELAAKPTVVVDGVLSPAADPAELEKLKAEYEASKSSMQAEFDQVKTKLAEEAKVREADITARLTAEISKAVEAAKVEAAKTSTGPAQPPVDVDSLVQAKLASLNAERSAVQKKAVDDAVTAALEKQKAELEDVAKRAVSGETEATQKNKLLSATIAKLREQLKAATGGATPAARGPPGVPATPAVAPTPGAPTPTPTPGPVAPKAANNGAANSGRGGPRGGHAGGPRGGRGGQGRGGGAAGGTPPQGGRGGGAAGNTGGRGGGAAGSTPLPQGLSLRGVAGQNPASGRAAPAGFLSQVLKGSAMVGGKRGRDSDEGTSTAAEPPKRPKQGEEGES